MLLHRVITWVQNNMWCVRAQFVVWDFLHMDLARNIIKPSISGLAEVAHTLFQSFLGEYFSGTIWIAQQAQMIDQSEAERVLRQGIGCELLKHDSTQSFRDGPAHVCVKRSLRPQLLLCHVFCRACECYLLELGFI